jgi:hypothetical protein
MPDETTGSLEQFYEQRRRLFVHTTKLFKAYQSADLAFQKHVTKVDSQVDKETALQSPVLTTESLIRVKKALLLAKKRQRDANDDIVNRSGLRNVLKLAKRSQASLRGLIENISRRLRKSYPKI